MGKDVTFSIKMIIGIGQTMLGLYRLAMLFRVQRVRNLGVGHLGFHRNGRREMGFGNTTKNSAKVGTWNVKPEP
jgi:hypothetical protein